MALVIAGRIVPLDRAKPDEVFKGRVYLDNSGTIDSVRRAGAAAPAGFDQAPLVDVGDAFVLPGLIDRTITSGTTRCRCGPSPPNKRRLRIMTAGRGPRPIKRRSAGRLLRSSRPRPRRYWRMSSSGPWWAARRRSKAGRTPVANTFRSCATSTMRPPERPIQT